MSPKTEKGCLDEVLSTKVVNLSIVNPNHITLRVQNASLVVSLKVFLNQLRQKSALSVLR